MRVGIVYTYIYIVTNIQAHARPNASGSTAFKVQKDWL